MADEIDILQERDRISTEAVIAKIREQAAHIEPGTSGDCDLCGEWSGRLVGGACAPCRDKYHLP